AGLSMGFSMVVTGILQAELPDEPWAHPVVAIGYTTGFIVVILARQQLFTENTVTALLPIMSPKSEASTLSLFRLWGIVLTANVAGTVLFALAAAELPLFSEDYRQAFFEIGQELLELSAWEMFARAVPAGWLVAALVWILPSVEGGRITTIFFLTWIVGLGGFPHIIVGMVETVYCLLEGGASFLDVVLVFALPTLAGNMFGGSALFALISYAQVRKEALEVVSEGEG
ncbi:MAG: formate/nitrite transporter family protein, partial [bacterium]